MKVVVFSDRQQHFNLGSLRFFGVSYHHVLVDILMRIPQVTEILFFDTVPAHQKQMGAVKVRFIPYTSPGVDIRAIREYLDDQPFILITGNTIPDLKFENIIHPHTARSAIVTAFITQQTQAGYFFQSDEIHIARDIGFERTDWQFHCSQVFMVSPEAIAYVSESCYLWYESLLPTLIKNNRRVLLIDHIDPVVILNTPDDLYTYYFEALNKSTNTLPGLKMPFGYLGEGTELAETTTILDGFVGKRCKLADEVIVRHSILTEDIFIDEHSRISDTIILAHTHIGKNCELQFSLIGEHVRIDDNTRLPKYAIIPAHSHITAQGGVLRER